MSTYPALSRLLRSSSSNASSKRVLARRSSRARSKSISSSHDLKMMAVKMLDRRNTLRIMYGT